MKTAGFTLMCCLLITLSLSAQTKREQKSDSNKIEYNLFQHALNDTLKLDNPFSENRFQAPSRKYTFPPQSQNLALNYRIGRPYTGQTFRMPILRPEFKSKMPVMKPDSTIQYFLKVQKIDR